MSTGSSARARPIYTRPELFRWSKARAALRLTAVAGAVAVAVMPAIAVESADQARQLRGVPVLTAAQNDRVEDLIAQMTLEEKVGQMMQITLAGITKQASAAGTPHVLNEEQARRVIVDYKAGSILNTAEVALDPEYWRELITRLQAMATDDTRLGVPLIYGVDSVHGANYIMGATLFPHNLNIAATFEPELAYAAGEVTGAETRAVGITWNFAPVCDVMRAPAWSRVFETFGEDPYVCSVMASESIRGMQGDDLSAPTSVAATAKHFLGYSNPRTGRDRTPAQISTNELWDVFMPPFVAAFDAGARTIMVNSGEVNGVPVHASKPILTELLRNDLGFEGVAVTDWEDVMKLRNWHRVAETEEEATFLAIDAGIDMVMTPYTTSFADVLVKLVRDGRISESRIDESVRRILRLKLELGLFDEVVPAKNETVTIGSEDAAALSLNAARRSITLLKNSDDLLPLTDGGKQILVVGPAADSVVPLHGSWTYSWQGTEEALYPESPTILDAMRAQFGKSNVSYATGSGFDDVAEGDIDAAADAAADADVVVLCLGEKPAVEKPGDISSMMIARPQLELARALIETGTPVVVVMVTNRARIISEFADDVDAILWAGHPGPHGGTALAEILAGEINPSGHLPFTYSRDPNALLSYDYKYSEGYGADRPVPEGFNPQFDFGSGLSYTTFAYDQLKVESTGDGIRASVEVANTGERAGEDVVMCYVFDEYASVTPHNRRLKGFKKIALEPGQTKRVTFSLDRDDLSIVDAEGTRVFEPGGFTVTIGGQSASVRVGE